MFEMLGDQIFGAFSKRRVSNLSLDHSRLGDACIANILSSLTRKGPCHLERLGLRDNWCGSQSFSTARIEADHAKFSTEMIDEVWMTGIRFDSI